MKIAVISHLKFPIVEPFRGGLEMHTHQLVKGLQRRGHEVVTYARAGSDASLNVRPVESFRINMHTGIDTLEDHPEYDEEFLQKLHIYQEIMSDIRENNFDVVHNNSLHYIPLMQSKQLPCPMVTVLHTPPFASMQSAATYTKFHRNADFLSVSEHTKRVWSPYLRSSRTVHNGIDLRKWDFSAEPINNKLAVWVGRFCPEKAPHLAIYAAIKAGYHLQLAGSVYDKLYFEDMVEPYLDHPLITYLGNLSHRELAVRIGKASVGLFTSTWDEPFGLVLTEMLACGTPIVAFDSGAAKEVICEECGIIVPKGDVEAMAAAIPQAAAINREDCRRRVRENFTLEHMIKGYESAYLRAIGRQTRRRSAVTTGPHLVERAKVG